MPFDIKFSKDLTIDIRKCPHLLIVGHGNVHSKFAESIRKQINSLTKVNFTPGYSVDHDWWTGMDSDNKWFMEMLEERYALLSATKLKNIEQYNERFKYEDWFYRIILASPSILKHDTSKQVLMKGRAVGLHIIMFTNSMKGFESDVDLFPVKIVYKTRTAKESVLLTGQKGAEKLKNDEFMFCELGKKPVIYQNVNI